MGVGMWTDMKERLNESKSYSVPKMLFNLRDGEKIILTIKPGRPRFMRERRKYVTNVRLTESQVNPTKWDR